MKKAHFISYLMPLALLGLGLTGCSSTGPSDTAEDDVEASEQALPEGDAPEAGRRPPHDRGRFGGPEHMLREALEGIALSADQSKAIDAALESARPDPDARPDHQVFFVELAKGVRAGKIDRAALDGKLAELDKTKPDMRAKMANTLQTVHDTLSAAQRKELVANVEAKMAEHLEGFQKGGDRAKGDHPNGDHDKKGRGPLGKMLKGLDLTDDQKAAIGTALEGSGMEKPDREEMKAKHDEMQTKMKALLDAFPSERFDANALLPEGPKGRGPREHLSHMVAALEVAVPILTESQRTVLAERLESGEAMKRMMHDKGGMKRHGSPKGAAGPGAGE